MTTERERQEAMARANPTKTSDGHAYPMRWHFLCEDGERFSAGIRVASYAGASVVQS